MKLALCLKVMAAASLAGAAPRTLNPQASVTPQPLVAPYLLVDDSVRAMLARAWDTTNVRQTERAYCVAYTSTIMRGPDGPFVLYHVRAAIPAHVVVATPNGVIYSCPRGPGFAVLHTHPPTSCDPNDMTGESCVWGGVFAWQCFPSPQDRKTLLLRHEPFGIIQCTREGLVPVFADGP